jgi:hypothetical protein
MSDKTPDTFPETLYAVDCSPKRVAFDDRYQVDELLQTLLLDGRETEVAVYYLARVTKYTKETKLMSTITETGDV